MASRAEVRGDGASIHAEGRGCQTEVTGRLSCWHAEAATDGGGRRGGGDLRAAETNPLRRGQSLYSLGRSWSLWLE